MARTFRIAVVIPARTCPYRQVVSVLSQLSSKDRLVVVLAPELSLARKRHKCRAIRRDLVTWVSAERSCGAGWARNLGVKALEGETKALLFCDADDCVGPTWLAELARPLLDGSADLTGGALRIRSRSGTQTVIIPKVDYWHRQAVFGGNMGITYEAWCKLGGFDESLTCCEDTDLAWRASNLGLKIQVVPAATVDYSLRSPIQEFRQRFRWGKSSVQLLQKHSVSPGHLPGLWSLFFDKRSTGFATSPLVAALGQWSGQCLESLRNCRLGRQWVAR